MTPSTLQTAIVAGAGLAGGLAATLLGQRGIDTTLVERRADPRAGGADAGRSINLALSHRGIQALRAAGVAEAVLSDAIPMVGRMVHDPQGQTQLQRYGLEGQCIHSIGRRALNERLLDSAEATGRVTLRFDTPVEGADSEGRVLLSPTGKRRKPETLDADLILGTDGAFSPLRASLQRTPRFDHSQTWLSHGYKELTIPPGPNGSFRMEPNALHIWPRHDFMMIALPNPDGSFTCTLFLAFEGEESFAALSSPQAVEAFFTRHFPDAVPLLDRLEETFFENPTSGLVTVRCAPWHFHNRVLLLGDAAHAIVPFYGQGMNAAFEDVRLLMLALDASPNEPLHAMLDHWWRERKPEADAIADLAMHNFLEMRSHVANPTWLARRAVHRALHQLLPDTWTPLYSMVTFSDVPYSEALKRAQRQDAWLNAAVAGGAALATGAGLLKTLSRRGASAPGTEPND